jgi:hypothetical protein
VNCKQYNFENLISGKHYDDVKFEWIDTPIEERQEMLWKFKQFLLSESRKGCKPYIAICNIQIDNLPKSYGIFSRLIINHKGNASYIAGQDYTSEMRTIKDLIIKHCF